MITGTTKNLGVMGWPIVHSLSPVLQNAALARAGLDYVYLSLPVRPDHLSTAVAGLKALQFRGWNVTIPHKTTIMSLLDDVDEDARIIGAVNTVVNDSGRLSGYNTDVTGFVQALQHRSFLLDGCRAVLFGAGGAARAVIWGLLKSGAASVCIGVRNPDKASALETVFRPYGSIEILHWETESFQSALREADLLVNTTPLGMTPHTEAMPPVNWEQVPAHALIYDIIYTPAETRFLREARLRGHVTINGEEMLAGQGAAAFEKWTGGCPDTALMRRKLREALSQQD